MAKRPRQNPYDILGISKDADPETIRKAHRDAAKKAHPDHGGTNEQMALVTLAKDVLTDETRKAKFDATGEFEETEPDTLDSKAMNHITGFINAVIDNPQIDPLTTNLIELTVHHFQQQIVQIKAKCEQLSKPLAKLEKVQTKFKRKGKGQNMIARLLEQRIDGTKSVIRQLEGEIPVFERARDLIQDYEFAFDAPQPSPQAQWLQGQALYQTQTSPFGGIGGMFRKGGF